MTEQTKNTKIPAPLYAAAGVGDLAYKQLRKLPTVVGELSGRAVANGYDVRLVETNTSDEDQSLQYNQIASASTLFDGRLSLLLGYRYDTHQRKQKRRVAANPDGTSILGATAGPGTLDESKVSVGTSSVIQFG